MFTMKKLALVGAAGLAALSMSCSDSDGDEGASGSWTADFGVTDGTTIKLSGEITANEGVTVSTLLLNEGAYTITGATGLLTNKVSLAAATVTGPCKDKSGEQTINFKIAVAFDDGTVLFGEKNGVKINCGSGTGGEVLTGKVLSFAGESYIDLNTGTTYKESGIASVKDKIELAAYYTESGEGSTDYIFTACAASTIGASCGGGLAGISLYVTDVPQTETVSELLAWYDEQDDNGSLTPVSSVSISEGKVFLVENDDMELWAVKIVSVGTKAVGIKIIPLDV